VNLLFKLVYRLYRLSSRVRYWVRRRFTRAGLAVLAALLLTGMMGVDTDTTVAYQAFTLLLLLLVVATSFACSFRGRFSATRLLPRFGTVGQPLHYSILVNNLTGRAQSDVTLLEDLADPRPSFREWLAVQKAEQKRVRSFRFSQPWRSHPFKRVAATEALLPPAAPHQETAVSAELTPLRRGLLRFIGLTFARPDPFGLFRAFAKVPLPQTVLVLPKRYPLPPIALPGATKYQEGGVALASSVGQSEEFVALRDYRHGDPLRHIHWRSWAKAGRPVVKEFEDEFFVRHALVLDTFAEHAQEELFEEAVAVAASFACTIPTQESLLDLLFIGTQSYRFTAGRGLAHGDQMLEILASVRECHDRPFCDLEHLVLDHISAVSGCVCVLMAWDQDRREFIRKLQALAVPLLVFVITAPGQGQSLDPGPLRDDPGKFHTLEVGRVEQGLARLK
jgi:uncharacterized protein (DUF58 family)